jgi:hypothetical protein
MDRVFIRRPWLQGVSNQFEPAILIILVSGGTPINLNLVPRCRGVNGQDMACPVGYRISAYGYLLEICKGSGQMNAPRTGGVKMCSSWL